MDKKKVCVIGLGEVGFETFKEMTDNAEKANVEVQGVEINPKRLKWVREQGYDNVVQDLKNIKKPDYYILCVYYTKDVFKVITKLVELYHLIGTTVIIESTIMPGTYKEIMKEYGSYKFNVAFFPHRFNPNDPEHHVFNLDRILGAEDCEEEVLDLYERFMPRELIHVCDYDLSELVKPMENAYRFMEIVIAQELYKDFSKKGMSYIKFIELMKLMNTKWNIDMREPRDGAGGKCLPKDTELMISYTNSKLLTHLYCLNELYKEWRLDQQ